MMTSGGEPNKLNFILRRWYNGKSTSINQNLSTQKGSVGFNIQMKVGFLTQF